MRDLDPKGAAANVLRKMALGRKVTPDDLGGGSLRWATRKTRERALKAALRELESGGYVSSKEVRPCQDYRSHHTEWSLTVKGFETATVLEVMES